MPTYDYACGACGATHEIFHSMNDRPRKKCPACGAARLERRIGSGAGVIFKGSGFYATDYRSASYSEGAKSEKSAESGAACNGQGPQGGCGACGPEA